MLWLRQLLSLGVAAMLFCLAHGDAYPQAVSPWACADNESPCKTVAIVHNSWHAAIVLRSSDLAVRTMPELEDFPSVQFIEFSWGDKDYFPDPQSGIFGAVKAALWSNGSVLHLVGFTDTIEHFYRGATITELRLSPAAYERMINYIDATFRREQSSGRARAAPGLISSSRFYPASRSFSLLRTCNTWVAEALEQAGLSISPTFVVTAANLQSQLSDAKPMP